MIDIEIPMEPVPKGRHRVSMVSGIPIMYTPDKTRIAERIMKSYASLHFKEKPLSCAVSVEVRYFFKRPKTVKRKYHTVKPDLDNLNKTLDAFNGILWEDDSQIINIISSKHYTDKDGFVRIKVLPLI